MNTDFAAQVRPILKEAIQGPEDTCATFVVTGDPDKWVQYCNGTLNVAYPFDEDPEVQFAGLLARPEIEGLSDFDEGKYATISLQDPSDPRVVGWIEEYFVTMLGCVSGGFTVDVTIEQL